MQVGKSLLQCKQEGQAEAVDLHTLSAKEARAAVLCVLRNIQVLPLHAAHETPTAHLFPLHSTFHAVHTGLSAMSTVVLHVTAVCTYVQRPLSVDSPELLQDRSTLRNVVSFCFAVMTGPATGQSLCNCVTITTNA